MMMLGNGSTPPYPTPHSRVSPRKAITPIVPKDFVTAPFFAAGKQTGPRTLSIGDVKWVIGDEHPTKRRQSPAFDMRHGRACFTLLSFRDRLQNGRDIHFSMNEFCNRYAQSRGGRYSREILNILFDLNDIWVRRTGPDGKIERFTVIGEIKIDEVPIRRCDAKRVMAQQRELWLDRVSLSPEFFQLLQEYERMARIRLDVLTGMTSPTAQTIYTFLPSRAVHHSDTDPFTIRLATLLDQIGLAVPPHKSVRKKIFTQNKNSILSQLDGAQILNGRLRASLADTKDGQDYNLLAWTEKGVTPLVTPRTSKSKLLDIWLSTGRTKAEFDKRVRRAAPLSSYAEDLLQKANVTLDGNERFFEMTAALLGEDRFNAILAQAKGDAVEGDPGAYPTKRLIYRLLEGVRARGLGQLRKAWDS